MEKLIELLLHLVQIGVAGVGLILVFGLGCILVKAVIGVIKNG